MASDQRSAGITFDRKKNSTFICYCLNQPSLISSVCQRVTFLKLWHSVEENLWLLGCQSDAERVDVVSVVDLVLRIRDRLQQVK